MQGFRMMLGTNDMLAYLSMMAPRLVELRRVLRRSGSIYLHCDPTASHYLKLLMDSIFGATAFRNEIIWHYRKWPTGKYTFQRNHDVILFYTWEYSTRHAFNQLFMDRAASTVKRFGHSKIVSGHDQAGVRLPSVTEDEDSEGVRMDDVWDIGRVPPIKQLYPTQKPDALLERIISASSAPGQVVLDPFCGCGTAIMAAQKLGRPWIGIDVTHLAVNLIRHRLLDSYGSQCEFRVVGEPEDISAARQLAREDAYQFQWWALGLVGARPADKRKGSDRGIDGRLFWVEDALGGKTQHLIISVKSGKTGPDHVRDLVGTIGREKAAIGALITLQEPTKEMRAEAASAGSYEAWGKKFPRVQIITIKDLLAGERIKFPPGASGNVTLKRAPKAEEHNPVSEDIPGMEWNPDLKLKNGHRNGKGSGRR
jgi:site-specific DNA-methyltransferase (adenine-specific)